MDKEYLQSLYTPEQQLLLFGDANYFNNQNNDFPFVNVSKFQNKGDMQTIIDQANPNFISPTYLMKQQLGMVPTGITASSAAKDISVTPFGTQEDITQGFVDTDEEDKVDFSTNKTESSGIAKLFEFLSKFSPLGLVRGGLESLKGLNQKFRDNDFAQSDTMEEYLEKRRRRKETDFLGSDDDQGNIITYDPAKVRERKRIMSLKPSKQDIARGRIPTRTKTTAPTRSFSKSYSDAKSAFFAK